MLRASSGSKCKFALINVSKYKLQLCRVPCYRHSELAVVFSCNKISANAHIPREVNIVPFCIFTISFVKRQWYSPTSLRSGCWTQPLIEQPGMLPHQQWTRIASFQHSCLRKGSCVPRQTTEVTSKHKL